MIVDAVSGITAITIAVFAIIQASSAKTQAESSKIQTELMKKELDIRLRPWILPVEIVPKFVTLENGTTQDFDETMIAQRTDSTIKVDMIHYKIILLNSGSIPAKISYTMSSQKEKLTRNSFNDKPLETEMIITPNYNYDDYIHIPGKELDNEQKYYAGISIEYVVNSKKIKSSAIYEITGNKAYVLEQWHDADK